MSRPADKDRVIWFLQEQGRSSNRNVRTTLKFTEEKYAKIKQELLEEKLIEKSKGQGGGIKLTARGMMEKTLPNAVSSVKDEKALYQPFSKLLRDEAKENDEAAVIIDTSALRKVENGQIQILLKYPFINFRS